MSLAFSRRSFLKYSAVAAVAVAGASLFSGCVESNSNQPAGKTGATLEVIGKHTLTKPVYDASNQSLKFHMNINCTSHNSIMVNANYFTVYVTRKDKTVEYNNLGNDSQVIVLSKGTMNLPKDNALDTDVTVKGIDIAAGDTVLVRYWPRPVAHFGNDFYQDIFATWDISADVAKKEETAGSPATK